jgi:hypothetical protein
MSRCESDLGNIHQQLPTLALSKESIDEFGYCILDREISIEECDGWLNYVKAGLSHAETGPLRTVREQAMQTYGFPKCSIIVASDRRTREASQCTPTMQSSAW